MDPITERHQLLSRRALLRGTTSAMGTAALGSLMGPSAFAGGGGGVLSGPHFAPKAKRVICLFMSGAPCQMDMWDYKPQLRERKIAKTTSL